MMESALEAADIAWWWMELPSGMVIYSPNKLKMLGRGDEHYTHYSEFTKLVHPDDYEKIMQDMRDAIDGSKPMYKTEYRILHKDGHYETFYDKGRVIGSRAGDTIVAGFVMKRSSR